MIFGRTFCYIISAYGHMCVVFVQILSCDGLLIAFGNVYT